MTAPNGQYGITTTGEIAPVHQVLSSLRDGTDLMAVRTEFSEVLDYWNKDRKKLTDLLSFRTTNAGEAVPQNISPALFEKATELGVPQAAGAPGDSILLGYMFEDFDLSTRLSRFFLRDADVRQVRAVMDNILTGDVTLTTGEILVVGAGLRADEPEVIEFVEVLPQVADPVGALSVCRGGMLLGYVRSGITSAASSSS